MVVEEPLTPMEPVRADPSRMPKGPEWVAQVKWDGVRLLAHGADETLRLYNRRRRERTGQYPELADLPALCAASSFLLDGEVVALGDDGRPSFHEVMRRDGLRRLERVEIVRRLVPVHYMVFDLLFCDGVWLTERPFEERQERLRQILSPVSHIRIVDSHGDGASLFDAVGEQDMEGIVVKRLDSAYYPGTESKDWVKIKHYRDLIAAVGGFTTNDAGEMNGLFLGQVDESGCLIYAGNAGAGRLSVAEWQEFGARLRLGMTESCPFAERPPKREGTACWVKPVLAVKVRFAAWTSDGYMRQPVVQAIVESSP